MSEDKSIDTTEDLELDGSEAESVVGGATVMRFATERAAAAEISRLEREGYRESACMYHGTLLEKNGHQIAVKFSHH
jgi:hypothetical protein